jgi:O-antigen ligase
MTIEWLKSLWQDIWKDNGRLRRLLLVIDVGLIAFWVYSVIYINDHPAEQHSDGFEILAAVPMTLIALCLSLPALLLLIWNRTLRASALVTLAAIAMNVWYWSSVLRFAGLGREWQCATFWEFCKPR